MKNVRFVGVINVSPESFYAGSIPKNKRELARRAAQLTKEGADLIDVGAMSTAPYLKTRISAKEEAARLSWAVKIIRRYSRLPISIDTSRFLPAQEGLKAGATFLNDITGLHGDPRLAKLAKKFKGIILMAHPMAHPKGKFLRPILKVKKILNQSLRKAAMAGVPRSKIILDPGIGFFRHERLPWWQWDVDIIKHVGELRSLNCPLLVGISRKSFIGHLWGSVPAEKRLEGSILVTRIAVKNGASWVRTHDVKETKAAVVNYWK